MRRCFQVSPNGNTVGLYLASDGGCSLAVVVYPKLWQSKPTFRRYTWADSSSHLAIAAGELDVIEIEGSAEQVSLLDRSVRRYGTSRDSLFVSVAPGMVPEEPPVQEDSITPIVALLGIEALMRRTGLGSVVPIDAGFVAPHLRDPLLRPILYRYFIDEVAGVIRLAQREYRWTDEILSTVTGRPDPRSLLVHAATGWPQISCRFQDFSRSTPTLTAICTALDHVANDGLVTEETIGLGRELRNESIRLRRLLAEVPTIPKLRALRAAKDAQRTGGSSVWERALQLAVGVLWPAAGLNLGEDDHAVEIVIDSSRVWELILLQLLRADGLSAFDGNIAEEMPFEIKRPWIGLGAKPPQPDLLVGDGANWAIVDAKYKDLVGTPAIDDLYQMFAYSHLGNVDGAGHISRLGLAYPVRGDISTDPLTVYPRTPDRTTSLAIHLVQFPSIDACRSHWSDFVSDQGPSFSAGVFSPAQFSVTT